jgi:RimJ/RimL family protein N-acetyltransferase
MFQTYILSEHDEVCMSLKTFSKFKIFRAEDKPKNAWHLTNRELDQLFRCSMTYHSRMKNMIRSIKQGEDFELYAIRAWSLYSQKLIGWAYLENGWVFSKGTKMEIGIYVSREHRGKGVATDLVRNIKDFAAETFPEIPVISSPWDNAGQCLFQKCDIATK